MGNLLARIKHVEESSPSPPSSPPPRPVSAPPVMLYPIEEESTHEIKEEEDESVDEIKEEEHPIEIREQESLAGITEETSVKIKEEEESTDDTKYEKTEYNLYGFMENNFVA